MSNRYQTINKISEYNTSYNQDNAPETILVTGSKNVLIDARNGKVRSRSGYTRLGASNTSLTPIRNGKTWRTSSNSDLPIRMYDDEWEVYLGTVDGTIIDAWTRFASSMSTTAIPRFDFWYDATEKIDLSLFVQGDDNIYEWNGAVSILASKGTNTLTKAGTNTWAQNRHYTTRNKILTNVRTGVDYTYTGGETTTTLTGVTPDPAIGDNVAGDIFIQKLITDTDKPTANRINNTIAVMNNQVFLGSESDELLYISKDTDYDDFTGSTPRIRGDGAIKTLTDPIKGFGLLEKTPVIFCGTSQAFRVIYTEITVGSTLTESLTVLPLEIGVSQGAFNQETIVQVGNGLIYLSNEPVVRLLESIALADKPQLKALSNPIKPDMDAEDFTGACAIWYKNAYFLSAPVNSHLYILENVEDASGNLRRFWQAPQVLPISAFSIIDDWIHGHSNVVPETYKLFTGLYDQASDDSKLPIDCEVRFAYRVFGDRVNLKTFDEFYVEGEIGQATNDCLLSINYDFGGSTQTIEKIIDGSDEDILEEVIGFSSLAQESLGVDSLGSLLNPPTDARKFRVVFEIAKEDFHEMQVIISSNEVDRYWSILSLGPNATLSSRKDTVIRK